MNLKKLRIEKKLTVPGLSKISGVPVRTIENIEKNGTGTISNAIKLADALGVTLDELCRDKK
jgi:transcriptional regulator with XRE-family HTH domain